MIVRTRVWATVLLSFHNALSRGLDVQAVKKAIHHSNEESCLDCIVLTYDLNS